MVHVVLDWGAFHMDSPEITALSSSIDALQRSNVWEYLGLTGREDIVIDSIDIKKLVGIVEEPKEEKPPPGITFIDMGEVRTAGYPRELLEYKVQLFCKVKSVFYNINFFVGIIWTRNIKSVKSVSIELLQCIPPDIKVGVNVTQEEFLSYGQKPRKVLS